jgi:hypothetical protein
VVDDALEDYGRLPDVDRIWRKAYSLRLCRRHYVVGWLISRLCKIRGGGRLSSLIQFLLWQRQFYQIGSKHLHNAPADSTAEASSSPDENYAGHGH